VLPLFFFKFFNRYLFNFYLQIYFIIYTGVFYNLKKLVFKKNQICFNHVSFFRKNLPKPIIFKKTFFFFFIKNIKFRFKRFFFIFINTYLVHNWKSHKLRQKNFKTTLKVLNKNFIVPAILSNLFVFRRKKNLKIRKNYWLLNQVKTKQTSLIKNNFFSLKKNLKKKNFLKNTLVLRNGFFLKNTNWVFNRFVIAPGFSYCINRFLKEFRLKTSRFLNYNLNKTIISYNTRRLHKYNFNVQWLLKLTGQYTSSTFPGILHPTFKSNTSNIKFKKKKIKKIRLRRLNLFWVSRITQKTLTPVRLEFNILNRKKFKYQKKITKYILQYYRFKVTESLIRLNFDLMFVLLRSFIVRDWNTAIIVLKKNFIFINGIGTVRAVLLNPGDFITLKFTVNLCIFLKWNRLASRFLVFRFFFYLKKWRKRSYRPFPKRSTNRIPDWIRKRLLFKETIPVFLEVDLPSMSFLVLFNWSVCYNPFHFMVLNQNTPATVRALNWKSLT